MRLNWQTLSIEEKIAVVRVGAAKKMSARQIAEEMDGCTKNAIIGFTRRTGIQLSGSAGIRYDDKKQEVPKTGLKTRSLAPLKYLKAKKPKGTKTAHTAAQSNVDAPPSGSDWKAMLPEQKAAYVKAAAAEGMTSVQIAASLVGATRSAVKGFASKHKITLPGNAPSARSARSAARTGGVQRIKPKPLTWAEMDVSQKVAAIRKHIEAGRNSGDIADIYGVSEKAVRSCAERQKIKLPKRPKKFGVSIMEIGSGQCRAPLWKDGKQNERRDISDYIFCGKPTKPGSSFCEVCHTKFWQAPLYEQRVSKRQMYGGYAR